MKRKTKSCQLSLKKAKKNTIKLIRKKISKKTTVQKIFVQLNSLDFTCLYKEHNSFTKNQGKFDNRSYVRYGVSRHYNILLLSSSVGMIRNKILKKN